MSVAGAALAYQRHIQFRTFDVMLRGRADSVFGAVQDADDAADSVVLENSTIGAARNDVYEVRDNDTTVLGRSGNWQGADANALAADDGFLKRTINGRPYRLLVLHGMRVIDPNKPGGGIAHRIFVIYGAPTEHLWKAVLEGFRVFAGASVLLLLVTGGIIAFLLHRGLLPLREMAAAAASVTTNSWMFVPPESALRTRELAPLTSALQATLARLEVSFIQQQHFVSDAAHELKTAVAVVKSSLQLLEMRERSPEEYRAGLDRSLADCERLEELVQRMLLLARIESAETALPASVGHTDLREHALATVAHLSSLAELRSVTVHVDACAAAPVALSAEDALLLCSNLLANALQHSASGSAVWVTVQVSPQGCGLLVKDEGDGIDPAMLPHVFERFSRGDPSRNRITGGAGLGLSICKAIVDRAHGTIQISSRLGVDTVVEVRLPAPVAPGIA